LKGKQPNMERFYRFYRFTVLKRDKPLPIKKKTHVCSLVSRSTFYNPELLQNQPPQSHMNFLYGLPLSSSCICCNNKVHTKLYGQLQRKAFTCTPKKQVKLKVKRKFKNSTPFMITRPTVESTLSNRVRRIKPYSNFNTKIKFYMMRRVKAKDFKLAPVRQYLSTVLVAANDPSRFSREFKQWNQLN